jgi:hypothetical protein
MTYTRRISGVMFLLPIMLFFPGAAEPQNGRGAGVQDTQLAKPVDWGIFEARMFKKTESKVRFALQTSWIPGENHKGMFRYRISAMPDKPDAYSSETIEMLMEQVSHCAVMLNLYDADGFVLRELKIPFTYGVDDKAQLRNLVANTSSQMDANEYRQFVGNQTKSGSWAISWACPPEK